MLSPIKELTDPYSFMCAQFMQSAWSASEPLNLRQQAGEQYLQTGLLTLATVGIVALQQNTNVDQTPYLSTSLSILKYTCLIVAPFMLLNEAGAGEYSLTIHNRKLTATLDCGNNARAHKMAALDIDKISVSISGDTVRISEGSQMLRLHGNHLRWKKRRAAFADTVTELSKLFKEHQTARDIRDLREVSDHPLLARD